MRLVLIILTGLTLLASIFPILVVVGSYKDRPASALLPYVGLVVAGFLLVGVSWHLMRSRRVGGALLCGFLAVILMGAAVAGGSVVYGVGVRARLAVDQEIIAALRNAIRVYQEVHRQPPPDKATAESLIPRPPAWQCVGQGWTYDPKTGRSSLATNDLSHCRQVTNQLEVRAVLATGQFRRAPRRMWTGF